MTTQTEHIIATLAEATDAEIEAGKRWYCDAYELAMTLTDPYDMIEMAAGVIAALSPLTSWERNKELAVRAFADGYASGTLGNSVRNADRILAGEHPLDVLKGDKVRNFYLSIMGASDAVCVDRHALEVYLGVRYADVDRPRIGKVLYREAAAAYVEAAQHTPFTPTQVQAITWLVWRRIHLTGTRHERFL